jgi:hypothetical protein
MVSGVADIGAWTAMTEVMRVDGVGEMNLKRSVGVMTAPVGVNADGSGTAVMNAITCER